MTTVTLPDGRTEEPRQRSQKGKTYQYAVIAKKDGHWACFGWRAEYYAAQCRVSELRSFVGVTDIRIVPVGFQPDEFPELEADLADIAHRISIHAINTGIPVSAILANLKEKLSR